MPVGDGDRSPCLVTPCVDEHKHPVHIYAHTPRAVIRIYKILSVFISNKIQEYYNKTLKFGGGSLMMWGCMTWEGVGFASKIDVGWMETSIFKF